MQGAPGSQLLATLTEQVRATTKAWRIPTPAFAGPIFMRLDVVKKYAFADSLISH
jgi:hypothetical protein